MGARASSNQAAAVVFSGGESGQKGPVFSCCFMLKRHELQHSVSSSQLSLKLRKFYFV